MSAHGGPADWWTNNTDVGRTHIATKGIVQSGLVLNLDAGVSASYPGSGTTWFDLSGNGNHGTLTNGPTFSGVNGGGIVIDGTNDYVDLSIANPYAETTIVFAKSNTSSWNSIGWISSSRGVNGHIIHPNGTGQSISYYIINQSSQFTLINNYTASNITIPHMYSISTNGSNSHKTYFDDILLAESVTAITRSQTPTPVRYVIGKDDTLERYGNGVIYVALKYNRQLSDAEIRKNFNALRRRFGI